MNKNYLNSKNKKANNFSIKQMLLNFVLLLSITFTFAQQTATITTTRDGFFVLQIDNTGGALLKWEVSGAITIPPGTIIDQNNPSIDLTGSGGGTSTITITSTDNFARLAKLDVAGMDVSLLDISSMDALRELRMGSNNISTLDLSGNTNLTFLNAKNNDLSLVDFSNNSALTYVDIESNDIAIVDISSLINIEHFDIEFNDISSINIDNSSKLTNLQIGYNPISNATIDYVLNTLDGFGLSGGKLEVDPSLTIEGAYVTTVGIDAFFNLRDNKGWEIDLDPSVDYGDAPDSYLTLSPNGAAHLRVFKQEFWLGLLRDTENNGIPGINADGDDTNNIQDEDGVDPIVFSNISETTTNVNIHVTVLNNTSESGFLHGWIDFDRNGTFEADEHVSVGVSPTPLPVPPTVKGAARIAALKRATETFTLTWSNIGGSGPDIVAGSTVARLRFTKDVITENDPGGIVNAGEVEDYGFEILTDFDKDGIPDVTDLDDDNDGILDTVEENGVADRDTDGDGYPDRIDLDADGDTCFDVDEAGFTNNGNNMLGIANPPTVDATGIVTSATDGYTPPNDLDGNGIADFQEAGEAASITTDPVDQVFVLGGSTTFTATAVADTYQWEVSTDGGGLWIDVADDANNTGATTNALTVSNLTGSDSNNLYRLRVEYLSFACDTTPATSLEAGFNMLITEVIKELLCNGDSDGEIDITVMGGILPYTYAWTTSDGSGLVPTDEDQTGLTAGTYDVTVTDSNGETITGSYVITEPDALALSANITHITINGANTGAIDLTVAGGTTNYTYLWSNGATTEDINGLTAGDYTVTVTDANGCDITATYTVNEPSSIIITLESLKQVTCNGASDGGIDISVNGGVTPYTYAWSTNGVIIANTEDLTDISGGTYTITVTDANGATQSETYTVNEAAALVISANITHVTTIGGNDGAIDLMVQGGTAPYTFVWSNGATTEDISGLVAGDYTVNITDVAGCTLTATFTISEPGNIIITGVVTDVTCNGGADGAINITVSGGTAPYTYIWSNGATTQNINGLMAGNYSVTVKDVAGIEATNSFSVAESTAIELNVSITNVSVIGGNDGAIDLTVQGGTAPYSYSWSNGAVTEDISGLIAGIYEVTVTDTKGCEAVASYTIFEPGGYLAIRLDNLTHVSCNGASDGAIDISVSGGTMPYTYSWSNGAITEDLIGIPGGTYTVTVTDANNVVAAESFVINESATLTLNAIITDVSINGANDGAINLIVMGGMAPFVFSWSNGATSEDILNLTAGTYTVSVTDTNDCTVEATYTVNEPGILGITAEILNVSCNGLSDGSINITVTGGITPFIYAWTTSDGSGLVADAEDQIGLTAGTYDVTVTDNNGATTTGSYTLTEPDVILISEVISTEPTCPSLDDGIITITATGTDLEYSIDNGVTFQDSNIFNGLLAGTYDVIARVKTSTSCSLAYDSQIILTAPNCADLLVTKTQTNGPNPVTGLGQTLGYTIMLENTGFVDLTDINIVDILPDGSEGELEGPTGDAGVGGIIEVGETWTYTISYTSNLDDFIKYIPLVNTVIVTVNELLDTKTDTATTPIEGTDTDKDGIIDVFDLDDDNDGILDTVEGEGDTNGDGVLDRLSLDADGDSCPDVTEAGFTNNGADMLGTANPPVVNADGIVTSANDGYTTPNDLDDNGVFDFQQAGSASSISSQPQDIEITLGDDTTFSVSGNATYYRWEMSIDRGSTWENVEESSKYTGTRTSTLTIHDARSREESNLYRVILTSPDYACDPNPELYSTSAMLSFNTVSIPNGFSPNGDGKNDYFIIPGLDQYPNFTMEVFDRWGNSVYKYENKGSLDPQWWDGSAKGSMVLNDGERVPAATYFYMINFNDNIEKPIKGWVYINY